MNQGFLSEAESQHLRMLGRSCLKPRIFIGGPNILFICNALHIQCIHVSQGGNDKEGESHIHHLTGKEICYVHPSRDPVIASVRRRFQQFVGFSFRGQLLEHENFQLVNYGVGGALRAHHDVSPFPFVSRLATFMVYLSSPLGGRTVFPGQGLGEEALEGDALLWHGQRADGEKDARGLHLACPVLAGGVQWQ